MEVLTFQRAKHLVERSGLGSELDKIQSFSGESLDFAIDQIISTPNKSKIPLPLLLAPSVMRKTKKAFRQSGNRKKANQLYKKERRQLKAWGMQNLLESDNALHERMVWFWHNHFTSSIKSVRIADWMLRQDLSI